MATSDTPDNLRRLRRITAAPCQRRLFGHTLWPELGQAIGLFPWPFWKPFGEHLGEEEGRRNAEKEETPNFFKRKWETIGIGLFGPPWRASVAILRRSSADLGPSWAVQEASGAISGCHWGI